MEDDSYLPRATSNEAHLRGCKGYCVACWGEVTHVRAWITEKDGGRTAQCPFCSIDVVVPESLIDDGGNPQRRVAILSAWGRQGEFDVPRNFPAYPEHEWALTA